MILGVPGCAAGGLRRALRQEAPDKLRDLLEHVIADLGRPDRSQVASQRCGARAGGLSPARRGVGEGREPPFVRCIDQRTWLRRDSVASGTSWPRAAGKALASGGGTAQCKLTPDQVRELEAVLAEVAGRIRNGTYPIEGGADP